MATIKRVAKADIDAKPEARKDRSKRDRRPKTPTAGSNNGGQRRVVGASGEMSRQSTKITSASKGNARQRRRAQISDPARYTFRPESKGATVVGLLGRGLGATLTELIAATGWQAHSVRGFLSGSLKKKAGLAVTSEKDDDGQRRYRIVS